jgi:hypothetical protein
MESYRKRLFGELQLGLGNLLHFMGADCSRYWLQKTDLRAAGKGKSKAKP